MHVQNTMEKLYEILFHILFDQGRLLGAGNNPTVCPLWTWCASLHKSAAPPLYPLCLTSLVVINFPWEAFNPADAQHC